MLVGLNYPWHCSLQYWRNHSWMVAYENIQNERVQMVAKERKHQYLIFTKPQITLPLTWLRGAWMESVFIVIQIRFSCILHDSRKQIIENTSKFNTQQINKSISMGAWNVPAQSSDLWVLIPYPYDDLIWFYLSYSTDEHDRFKFLLQ